MSEQDRTSEALNILDEYYLFRGKYARYLRDRKGIPSKVFRKIERDYLRVEQEILELMGANTGNG